MRRTRPDIPRSSHRSRLPEIPPHRNHHNKTARLKTADSSWQSPNIPLPYCGRIGETTSARPRARSSPKIDITCRARSSLHRKKQTRLQDVADRAPIVRWLLEQRERPNARSHYCVVFHSQAKWPDLDPAEDLERTNAFQPAHRNRLPNRRGQRLTSPRREYQPASQYSQNKTAVIASEPKNVAECTTNRLYLVLNKNVASQQGIDTFAVERARNKSVFETNGSDQGFGDPCGSQRMSCPAFCRTGSGCGTEDFINGFVFDSVVGLGGSPMQ